MTATPMRTSFDVRFSETDALQHVSNVTLVVWFEAAKDELFRYFNPELSLDKWNLILANYNVTFHDQMYFGSKVTVDTYISRIGGSSLDVYQEVWQNEKRCASGVTTLVHFDFTAQKAAPIPESVKEKLRIHFIDLEAA